ncbi:hypothetical protein MFIFM68171_02101 [Madurella fahalii]|uniref:Uncharacterized protein n=1 Tax=Madurella fahalii TaxID=1157608 RepID=A0ABQ0G2D1_9PEZI
MMESPAAASTLSPFLWNRVFILYEALPSTAPLTGLRLQATQPNGKVVDIWDPIKSLHVRDTTIHKFAARALLGDLERGQSRIHLDPNAPSAGSMAERELWTSFYAVEGRLRSNSSQVSNTDPFMNFSEPGIEVVVESDLGLLRSRGVLSGGAPNHFADLGALEELDDDTDDNEDETDSSQDGYDGRDERSDDDEDGPNGGVGYGAPRSNRPSSHPPATPMGLI